jgi:N-acetyl-gamma-glutamyl-phosphate reductase
MIRAKIIGAGGYGGVGIAELLLRHPEAEITTLVDVDNVGVAISVLYPHLLGFLDQVVLDPEDSRARAPVDVAFMATPDGVGMKLAPAELEKGVRVIDYSGDFRFNSEESYADYAGRLGMPSEHACPELLTRAVYGLAELHRSELTPETPIVGNPGCFAVSCILGLAPAVKLDLIDLDGIICDCKSGVSGAGKKPGAAFHYPARHEQINAYKLAGHQHVCEIERELGLLVGSELKITFTAQVVPVSRGIVSSLYGKLSSEMTEQQVLDAYRDFYRGEPFVRVYESSASVGSMSVRGSNCCDLVVSVDQRTGRLRVISHIDNLMKGQAGSALQCMNLLFGLPEAAGLNRPGIYP